MFVEILSPKITLFVCDLVDKLTNIDYYLSCICSADSTSVSSLVTSFSGTYALADSLCMNTSVDVTGATHESVTGVSLGSLVSILNDNFT
jgi:hypothetical protein